MNGGPTEGWAAIAAALMVLLSAMWNPRVSLAVSLIALLALGIVQLWRSRPS